ncbi:hypothetical protein BDZ89DRAFT_893953, partial [Hymenopellis radicata]
PASVITYLNTYWMAHQHMWAIYARADRNIFQESDTNMLTEAWHHMLKGYFGDGKRNRRMDHLIHTLTVDAMQYFKARHQRQLAGIEGHNLEQAARLEVNKRA